jgi:20S proteasome alpha/beta subunit
MTRDQYIRLEIPHYVFAPSGRLYTIEAICEAIEQDDNSNTVVVLQVAQGIVIVTTVPSSPYMKSFQQFVESEDKKGRHLGTEEPLVEPGDDDLSLWLSEEDIGISPTVSAPFLRIVGSDRILAITAGNPLESQILRSRLVEIAQHVHDEFGTTSSAADHHPDEAVEDFPHDEFFENVARQLADDNQLRTQQFQHGKVLAATMILMQSQKMPSKHHYPHNPLDEETTDHHLKTHSPGIYRIDPTGQFFPCQAVVAGRQASQLEAWLQKELVQLHNKEINSTDSQTKKNSNAAVRTVLAQQLSLEQALVLARDCILQARKSTTIGFMKSSAKDNNNKSEGARSTFRSTSKVRLRGIVMPIHGKRIQCYTSKELYALRSDSS